MVKMQKLSNAAQIAWKARRQELALQLQKALRAKRLRDAAFQAKFANPNGRTLFL